MEFTEIRVRGIPCSVRCVTVNERIVIASGKWPRVAEVKDEEWIEGEIMPSLPEAVDVLKHDHSLRADIFTFSQKVAECCSPRFPFFHRLDSVAVIPVVSFSDWWNNRISKQIRSDIKRSVKREVEVRIVPFSDEFIRGIVDIYNETPIRQGRPFWHYGKGAESIKEMTGSYLERSEFLGAYVGDDLIGFLKAVYVDGVARIMQIIAKEAHQDRRPTNALLAKAVELCELKKCSHLTYANYQYLQGPDSLTDFKRRNGFEEFLVPRYYVPLSAKGKLILSLGLERGVRAWIPSPLQHSLRQARASIHRRLR